MAPSVLALLGATIVFTSFLSGVFGMAGGMILLGVLLNYFDVATAMILFSIIQLFANGWRALQWRSYVLWPIFGWYVLGALISVAGMRTIAFVPDKAMVFLMLGLMPFAIEALPAAARPNIEWRGVPFLTGVATTVIQILSGIGGMFLDIFFQKSMLDRKTTNATKAVTQSFSHVVRALYFGSLSGIGDVPLWATGPAILLAIAGTSLAPFVLERMSDHGFRQWTRMIILAIGVIFLFRAGSLIWHRY
ncbi:MAG: sulfite exporter TauE/SafE family protein [Alphaproteobacteria bacterium]|nr:MAG: sulfite exporter TauE/SafE family protein [Alphaproteobacteria bacterium]